MNGIIEAVPPAFAVSNIHLQLVYLSVYILYSIEKVTDRFLILISER